MFVFGLSIKLDIKLLLLKNALELFKCVNHIYNKRKK